VVRDVIQSGGEEEVEDIGKMFAVYGGKGGSLPHSVKSGNRSNLNRLSPFSVSFALIFFRYCDSVLAFLCCWK